MVVCFSGKIGSGKSSVSKGVARALAWKHAAFGDYLRSELQRRGGDATSREELQEFGQQQIEDDLVGCCTAVLAYGGIKPEDSFVLDGVRHVDVFHHIAQTVAPTPTRLLFLATDDVSRRLRVALRPDRDDLPRAETHRVESELSVDLQKLADGIIDATAPLEKVTADCLVKINGWLVEYRTQQSGSTACRMTPQ